MIALKAGTSEVICKENLSPNPAAEFLTINWKESNGMKGWHLGLVAKFSEII